MTNLINEGERLDDLQRDGLMIIQNPSWFCFGMDAVLLSHYASVRKNDRCMDLCCGNGIISLLMSAKEKSAKFYGIELQEEIADLAKRSIIYNKREDNIIIENMDIKEAPKHYEAASFDIVTCNPPYMINNHGLKNKLNHKTIARHEIFCTIDDVINTAKYLLKTGGHFYMIHRPFRLSEIFTKLSLARLEPKNMRLVLPYADKKPNMVLIEAIKDANPRLEVESPLVVYKSENVYTDEIERIYRE